METLDLHGITHDRVEAEVEEFILSHSPPLEIITGNSTAMQQIVVQTFRQHGLTARYPDLSNLGSMIIGESPQ